MKEEVVRNINDFNFKKCFAPKMCMFCVFILKLTFSLTLACLKKSSKKYQRVHFFTFFKIRQQFRNAYSELSNHGRCCNDRKLSVVSTKFDISLTVGLQSIPYFDKQPASLRLLQLLKQFAAGACLVYQPTNQVGSQPNKQMNEQTNKQ